MDNEVKDRELNTAEPLPEWVKPEVSEFDVNSTTLGGSAGTWDDNGYS